MIPSWVDVGRATETHDQLVNTVHGVLQVYDLPDLVKLCGDRIVIKEPANVLGEPLDQR